MRLHHAVVPGLTGLLAAALVALLSAPANAGTRPPAPVAAQAVVPLASCTQQSFLEGDHYSALQIAQLAQAAGFTGQDLTISVAVALAESAGWTHARLINTDCSIDRGLWQINSYWHGEVSDACAFSPSCAASATHTIWANGGWTQWVTYTNGAYQSHMAEAQAAVNQLGGGGGGGGGGNTGGTWAAGTWYAVGAQVTYGGHTYQCIQAHQSQAGWEPPNVPALWHLVS